MNTKILYQLSPKQVFLIDAIGALLSAISLGIVLPRFQALIGMPTEVLYVLALMACAFCFFSTFSFLFINHLWRTFLRIIAIVNLLYCLITLGLVLFFFSSLTLLGISYFVIEIIIIVLLVRLEFWYTMN